MGASSSVITQQSNVPQRNNLLKNKSPQLNVPQQNNLLKTKSPTTTQWSVMLQKLEKTQMPLSNNTIFLVFTPPQYNYNYMMKYMSTKLHLPVYSIDAVSISSVSMEDVEEYAEKKNGCILLLELSSGDLSNIPQFYDQLSHHYIVTIFLKLDVHVMLLLSIYIRFYLIIL